MMKRLMKLMVGFSLFFFISMGEVGHAQSLEGQREEVIESFMMGITEDFSYEEVDAYLSEEEARILETGETRSLSSYGIDGNHSTGQSLGLVEYLTNYLNSHTDESDDADLYTYAVDFSELNDVMCFYHYVLEKLIVKNNGDEPTK